MLILDHIYKREFDWNREGILILAYEYDSWANTKSELRNAIIHKIYPRSVSITHGVMVVDKHFVCSQPVFPFESFRLSIGWNTNCWNLIVIYMVFPNSFCNFEVKIWQYTNCTRKMQKMGNVFLQLYQSGYGRGHKTGTLLSE